MSSKVFLVARREWLENVRTKAFWIGLLIMPLILVAAIVAPSLLAKTKAARSYAVIDQSGWLLQAVDDRAFAADLARLLAADADARGAWPESLQALAAAREAADAGALLTARAAAGLEEAAALPPALAAALRRQQAPLRSWWDALSPEAARELDRDLSRARFRRVDDAGGSIERLNRRLQDDQLFAYLVIAPEPALALRESRYVSRNLTDSDLERWFTRLANDAVRERRLSLRNVDPELAAWIQADFQLEMSKISDSGAAEAVQTEDLVRQWAPVAFVYLLWLSIFTVSQMLLSNTVEEKSNRLMEVLLSSVSPLQLMLGKILGIAATGLTMVGTWVACLVAAALALPSLFEGSALDFDLDFLVSEPRYLGSFLLYFVLGYLLYAAILVAIGSVCNTLKEAQNLQAPIVVLLMVPLLMMMPISQDPNGAMAVLFSYFPPTTPFVMMNRAAGDVSLLEYLLTTVLLLAAVVFAIWAAAKIFRVGVLMTGKPPSVREMLRWLRTPVGNLPARRGERTAEH